MLGTKIVVSEHATEEYTIFPDRKRTKRGERRFRAKWGTDKRRKPCAFQTPYGIVMHPRLYDALTRATTGEAEG